MSQDAPGFLTDTQRKYLAETDEWRKQKRKENPNIRRRIREAMNGAEEDWGRILASDAKLLDGLDMTKERIEETHLHQRTNDKVENGLKAALAQAHNYGNDDVIDLDGDSPDEVLDDLEQNQSKVQEFVGKSVVQALAEGGDDIEGFSDEQMRRLIQIILPDKDQTQEIIVEEFSNR